jgi:hypothetical protein
MPVRVPRRDSAGSSRRRPSGRRWTRCRIAGRAWPGGRSGVWSGGQGKVGGCNCRRRPYFTCSPVECCGRPCKTPEIAKPARRPWSARCFWGNLPPLRNAFRERKMTPLRINLEQEEIPTHWYNVVADMPNPPAPPLGPDGKPVPPEADGGDFPGPILEQEMSAERWIAIPEEVRQIYACGARPAVPRPAPGAGARHAGQDFLQVRRRLAGRFAQAQLGRAAGLLQQAGRHQAPDHRNRRRPVGLVDRLRRPDVRPAGARLHGQGQLRAEALSAAR